METSSVYHVHIEAKETIKLNNVHLPLTAFQWYSDYLSRV